MDVSLATATWNSNCVDGLPSKLGCTPSNWNSGCVETFKQMIFAEILQDAMGASKFTGCESVVRFCQWDSLAGTRARQICPVTCGCHDPMSPIAIGSKNNGCSPGCSATDKHTTVQTTRPCQDLGKDDQYWTDW